MSAHKTKRSNNIFISTLKLLNIKHTPAYSNKFFNEHPHKNNFLGLSKMFCEYDIDFEKIEISNKDHLIQQPVPFIAQLDYDCLVIVKNIGSQTTLYADSEKEFSISTDDFYKKCDKTILVFNKSDTSIEPNYQKNKKNQIANFWFKNILIITIIFLAAYFYINHKLYFHPEATLILIFNLFGFYISYLLLTVQFDLENKVVKKLCLPDHYDACNRYQTTKKTYPFGLISWNNIGLGYFLSNTLIILFFPHLIYYLALINILSLPYTFWNIWYQKTKLKSFCTLCVIVQILLWLIFIVNYLFGQISIPNFNIYDIFLILSIYILPILGIYFLIPKLAENQKMGSMAEELNKLKAKEEVFNSYLKQQPYYQIDNTTSNIIWGDKNASKLITILTHPHCERSSETHSKIQSLLKHADNKFCVQFVFIALGDIFNSSNKFLIASYLCNDSEKAKNIFNEWFKKGKYRRDKFFNLFDFEVDLKEVEEEFNKHKEWFKAQKFSKTPHILVNGHELPESYCLDDLLFFF